MTTVFYTNKWNGLYLEIMSVEHIVTVSLVKAINFVIISRVPSSLAKSARCMWIYFLFLNSFAHDISKTSEPIFTKSYGKIANGLQ